MGDKISPEEEKTMSKINVIVVKDNVVEENILIEGDDSGAGADLVEKVFFDKCQEYISNWDEYTDEDKEGILDDGVETFGHGVETFGHGSVCINWPEIRKP